MSLIDKIVGDIDFVVSIGGKGSRPTQRSAITSFQGIHDAIELKTEMIAIRVFAAITIASAVAVGICAALLMTNPIGAAVLIAAAVVVAVIARDIFVTSCNIEKKPQSNYEGVIPVGSQNILRNTLLLEKILPKSWKDRL